MQWNFTSCLGLGNMNSKTFKSQTVSVCFHSHFPLSTQQRSHLVNGKSSQLLTIHFVLRLLLTSLIQPDLVSHNVNLSEDKQGSGHPRVVRRCHACAKMYTCMWVGDKKRLKYWKRQRKRETKRECHGTKWVGIETFQRLLHGHKHKQTSFRRRVLLPPLFFRFLLSRSTSVLTGEEEGQVVVVV